MENKTKTVVGQRLREEKDKGKKNIERLEKRERTAKEIFRKTKEFRSLCSNKERMEG